MSLSPSELLRQRFGDQFTSRWIDRLALAHDASLYRLVPEAVLRPSSTTDIVDLFRIANEHRLHVTFRAAGTSLSGQAVTDGILVDISRKWDTIEILDHGAKVRCGPGVTGGRVNAALRRHGRKIGPDPASIQAAMIGGIVANNASGMCCGVQHNSYHTMESIRFILPSGHRFDTSRGDEDERLLSRCPDVYETIESIRKSILRDQYLSTKIRSKYKIKNTIGYSLNAFLDFEKPIDILAHLLVGSEGTLGFVEDITFTTLPDARQKFTKLFMYESLAEACAEVPQWESHGAAAIEIMDDASIASYVNLPRTPSEYRTHSPGCAALLVEFHDTTPPDPSEWIQDETSRLALWSLRKGLMPTVGAARRSGTTMINEDIAVEPSRLGELVTDVKGLFETYGYTDAIIFGHAKDGNIHFVISQDFSIEAEVHRYHDFMQSVADIVVGKYGGSLKAEHGTGRNMASFVEQEWGSEATRLMWLIKNSIDPSRILNPDVLLSSDKKLHLKNIKPVPVVDATIDACIECGFCESACPTTNLTLTPRQRIVIERELSQTISSDIRDEVEADRQWMSIDSCATDGVCSWSCPVGINTGSWVKEQRAAAQSENAESFAHFAAGRWAQVETLARGMRSLGKAFSIDRIAHLGTGSNVPQISSEKPQIVFVPGCPSRWFGKRDDGASYIGSFVKLCERAGVSITIADSADLCCGQPLESTGFPDAANDKASSSFTSIDDLVPDKSVPIVSDVSTCAHSWLASRSASDRLVFTPAKFLMTVILPRLQLTKQIGSVVLHPGCGSIATGDVNPLLTLLEPVADTVTVPASASCCGMAGIHGVRHPEVVSSALEREVQEIKQEQADIHCTLNPMCQAALERESNVKWMSVWELLDQVTS